MLSFSCEKASNSTDITTYKLINITKSNSSGLTSDQILFKYNPTTETLRITHKNAALNYCSNVEIEVSINANKILIKEKETIANCDSLNLYTIEIELKKLPKANYNITIIEPYVNLRTEKLDFQMKLNELSEGNFSVKRNFYPWGN